MKSLFFAVTLLVALPSVARAESIQLDGGITATVLAQIGVTTAYTKGLSLDRDGKVKIDQGQVFAGTRLVKKLDGQCLMVRESLVGFQDVIIGDMKVQRPEVTSSMETVSCNS